MFQPTLKRKFGDQPLPPAKKTTRNIYLRDVVDNVYGIRSNSFKVGPLKDLFLLQEIQRKLIFKEENDLEMNTIRNGKKHKYFR